MPSPLRDAIARGLSPGADLAAEIHALGDVSLADPADALAVCEAIDRLPPEPPDDSATRSPLHAVLGLLQGIETRQAYEVVVERGVPRLSALVGRLLEAPDAGTEARRGLIAFALKVLGLYRVPEAVELIGRAARTPGLDDAYLWEVIFRTFDQQHPLRLTLCDRLRDPLPGGFAGIAYLDFANTLARAGFIDDHPFDTPEGRARLLDFLRDSDPDRFDRAHRAAAALPSLGASDREPLLALAMDHPSARVQMEGAWASARLGSEAGVRFLSRMCLDLNHSLQARLYLQELDRHDAVPERCTEPNFEAMAKMVDWLSHPMEFGRPPDEIALVDTRELLWPPTSDLRRLWIFRYRYAPAEPGQVEGKGVGVVGSITFALFGETSPEMPPEDIYALHCCWELQVEDDPRAPASRSVAEGRRLLGFGEDGDAAISDA
ncbi:HEAT repeat domain-containing protein [Tautonia sociabilis]|uniref:HEAT repeat domain-containing protein n=1 Tax=Tautonia sociabilis TaxID=2080755 RepID=A0A432MG06_9BACT|nr:HEAT repeat domain-containing protein [Tautonia sociabilis]RUL85260.1 hypothetical protein TsocGM_18795 [Tautonia sociabilis]